MTRPAGDARSPQGARILHPDAGSRARRDAKRKNTLLMTRKLRKGFAPPGGAEGGKPTSEAPVRVLLIAPSLDILGGQAVQAARLLEGFRDDTRIRITFLPMNPPLPRPFRFLSRIKYARTIATFAVFLVRLLRELPEHQVVHAFSASFYSFLLAPAPALVAARLFRKRSILNYRDGRAPIHLRDWRSARLVGLADVIVAPSPYLVDVFAEHGFRGRSIFNVIDAEAFTYRVRERPRPVFLHNRSLEPLYNVACTLKAFRRIQERYPGASLILAHDGVLREELEALASELGLRNTRFVGSVPQARVPELYDTADIYLTSPDLDCMPGSILECYASGLPLVATAAGGIPYIVRDGETGLLVPPDDEEALAAAALRILEEPGLSERLAEGGRRELEQYTMGSVGERWVSLYQELALDAGPAGQGAEDRPAEPRPSMAARS